MCGSMVGIQCATAENRRGKKKEEETTGQNIMSASATQGGHKKHAQTNAAVHAEFSNNFDIVLSFCKERKYCVHKGVHVREGKIICYQRPVSIVSQNVHQIRFLLESHERVYSKVLWRMKMKAVQEFQ